MNNQMPHKGMISIIIVNHNGEKYLPNLLLSLKEQTIKNFEVIFWDNASTDGSKDLIQKYPELNIRLIESAVNLGFAKANNLALQHCTGEYIMLLNNDTALHPDCLEHLMTEMGYNDIVAPIILFYRPHLAITVGSVRTEDIQNISSKFPHVILNNQLYVNQKIRHGDILYFPHSDEYFTTQDTSHIDNPSKIISDHQKLFDSLSTDSYKIVDIINSTGLSINYQNGKAIDRDIFQTQDPSREMLSPEAFSGCCFMIRKSILDHHGLFDEDLFMYYEDVDFFWRISKINQYRLKLVEKALIRHDFRSSSNLKKKYYIDRNRLLTLKKNGLISNYYVETLKYGIHVTANILQKPSAFRTSFKALLDSITMKTGI